MFRRIAQQTNSAQGLVQLHPVELMGLLEQAWNLRNHPPPAQPTGHPDHRSDTPGLNIPTLPIPVLNPPNPPAVPAPVATFSRLLQPDLRWDHLIYAYMIENTRIYEIFRRVVHDFVHGERSPGSPDTMLWLRNTEELFYRDPPAFSITTLTSHIRPDLRGLRRNAYQRMFGMDLIHGQDDGTAYSYTKAKAANNDFVATFEELLREVWVGHINRSTTTSNPTDDAKITDLARSLHDMLKERRLNGNLSREEFFSVSMMSWFHLTVEQDPPLPIIIDLGVKETTPEQRLFEIAKLVGLPAHMYSRSYFQVADAISAVLIAIETGALNTTGAARTFYDPTFPNNLANFMNTINTHWSKFSGRDMKAGKVVTVKS